MVARWYQHLAKRLEERPVELNSAMLDYPSDHDWPDHKKDRYERNIVRFFYEEDYLDPIGVFTLMVKSGEVYSSETMLMEAGFLQG